MWLLWREYDAPSGVPYRLPQKRVCFSMNTPRFSALFSATYDNQQKCPMLDFILSWWDHSVLIKIEVQTHTYTHSQTSRGKMSTWPREQSPISHTINHTHIPAHTHETSATHTLIPRAKSYIHFSSLCQSFMLSNPLIAKIVMQL